ncbi:trace amine-associated receptor 8b-like [Acropora millepora]|uniref:trace amine-associated receptor 8b-like n=1 Tax=Acropora millepora TaxID=45264 RepID=UPI001CF231D6|nr:trace amine-associated receptor 8b-like [Acropora millepora]
MANHSLQGITTSSLPFFSASECIPMLMAFGMEAVAIVTLNALTIIVYLKEYGLRKRGMYLVINLAFVDMLVPGCAIIECWFFGSYCKFWTINSLNLSSFIVIKVWFRVIPLASVTNLAAISLERMHATFRPFQHRLIKKKMFGAAIAIVWIATGLCSATGVLVDSHYQTKLFSIKLNRGLYTLYLSFFLFCLLIILVSYSSIAVKIACGNQLHHDGVASRETRLTKTLFIVTVASLTLTQPIIIFGILDTVSSHTFTVISHQTWFRLYYYFGFLFCSNSLVNPICYGFRIPEFRRALFSFLRCRSLPQPAQVFPLNKL